MGVIMTKTITISLTEDLHKEFLKVKSQFNVSKVCQDAIGLRVARHRIAQDGDLIDFLKAGKMSAMDDSEAIGRKEAQHWIKNKCISFNDFLGVSKITWR